MHGNRRVKHGNMENDIRGAWTKHAETFQRVGQNGKSVRRLFFGSSPEAHEEHIETEADLEQITADAQRMFTKLSSAGNN